MAPLGEPGGGDTRPGAARSASRGRERTRTAAGAGPGTPKAATVPRASDQTLRVRGPGRRVALRRQAAVSAATLALAGVGYAGLRAAGAFSVDAIRVTGTSGEAQRAVLAAADARAGSRSLLAVDPTRLAAALQALPTVQRAHVDRDFPHTLRVSIVPERPVATARLSGQVVVVAASGRILPAGAGSGPLPSVTVPPGLAGRPGGYVVLAGVRREVAVAAALPRSFPAAVASVAATSDGLVATTGTGAQIRLGDETDLRSKLEIAGRILRGMPASSRSRVRYVEVSAPAFPAVMTGIPNPATAGLVPEEGVPIPTLTGDAASRTGEPTPAGVQSGVEQDPSAVTLDLFGR